jgi:hypothetical protein
MQKRVKHTQETEDGTQSALRAIRKATGDETFPAPRTEPTAEQISAVMRVLGKRGGLIGGNARKEALSPAKRKAIARKAAEARWGKTD